MQDAPHENLFPIAENVLLSRSQREKKAEFDNLIAQAKKKAKNIIAQSQKKAEEIERQASIAGYERGVLIAAEAVCQYIASADRQAKELSGALKEKMENFLSEFFADENTLLTILDRWVAESVQDETATVQILMPESCRPFHRKIVDLIGEKRANNAVVVYHSETEFVFKCKDRIASFDPKMLIAKQTERLLGFDKILDDCKVLSAELLNELSEIINGYSQQIEKAFINNKKVEANSHDGN
ncbi:hypothetical protein [Kalamiella sp. sgz302252]|uniref:hypothetical protein n=1 Tax=Pantoea sp. sgz302252 TaxID=3341827 RepID=UPI0036D23931